MKLFNNYLIKHKNNKLLNTEGFKYFYWSVKIIIN